MKSKKIFALLTTGFMLLTLSACHQQPAKKAAPLLTKTEVINKAQRSYKSGQVIQSLRLATDTSSQTVVANTIFGGSPLVFHLVNQTTSKGKTSSSEEWVNASHVFLHGKSGWFRANLTQLSGHSYAELADMATNNQLLQNPSAALRKAYHLKRKGQTYTLTATSKNQRLMKQAVSPVIATIGQSSAQEKVFRRIQKYGQYQQVQVKLVMQKKKLVMFNVFVTMKLGKLMKARIGQSFGNFGSHDFLKVPTSALNNQPLPVK